MTEEMTQTTKEKLLEVLGDFAHDDLSVSGLLDVLRLKLDRQEEIIKKLRFENAAEREKLIQDREYLNQEIREIQVKYALQAVPPSEVFK